MKSFQGSGSLCGVVVGSLFCFDRAYDLFRQAYPSAVRSRLRQKSVVHHVVNRLGLAVLCRVHSKNINKFNDLGNIGCGYLSFGR